MMRILCVGDIHAKPWVVHAISLLVKDYDKVIFLGDYADDWGANAQLSESALESVVALSRKHDNVVLIRGNHDFSARYGYTRKEFICSGFDIGTYNACKKIFDKAWKNMYTCYIVHDDPDNIDSFYWISHAGITSGWDKEWNALWGSLSLNQKAQTSLLDTEDLLAQVGSARGGMSSSPSPIWADRSELVAYPKPYINQIVGHTPVKTVTCHEFKNGDGSRNKIFFCDTFSTYMDGTPYGDGSCLSLDTETGGWEKVYPMIRWT